MIVEYIRYRIVEQRGQEFERAYATARSALEQSPHCLAYELAHCIEDPTSYVVRIEWDSLEGHTAGFRSSPVFQEFFTLVRPFFDDIEEMHHYEPIAVAGGRAHHSTGPER